MKIQNANAANKKNTITITSTSKEESSLLHTAREEDIRGSSGDHNNVSLTPAQVTLEIGTPSPYSQSPVTPGAVLKNLNSRVTI